MEKLYSEDFTDKEKEKIISSLKQVIEVIVACLCDVQPNKLSEEESR